MTGATTHPPARHQPNGIITLLTDFGMQDPFVGVLRGVVATRFPEAQVIDLCHGIPAQDTRAARYWLTRSYAWFPPGTTHVAVVDPGVGSQRGVLAGYRDGHYFVAPEGDLLPTEWLACEPCDFVLVDLQGLHLEVKSNTFHARDVFVPVACELASRRTELVSMGRPVHTRDSIQPKCRPTEVRVIAIDRFGNLITDLDLDGDASTLPAYVDIEGRRVPIKRTYCDVNDGDLVAVVNGFGTLEIARRNGSALHTLGAGVGTRVVLAPVAAPAKSEKP